MVIAISGYALSRVARAAPLVPTEGLWIDTVEEGDISRELHGVGELVPDDDAARWASADVEGRVERKRLESGAVVKAGTVLLELTDPDVAQAAVTADLALEQALSAYNSLEASLEAELLSLRSTAAAVEAERAQAVLQAQVDATLAKKGLLAGVTADQSTVRADALTERARLERNRVTALEQSQKTRLAAQQSEVKNHRTVADLKHRDLAALTVRAGIDGVLQDVVVEVGQRVTRGANLARVIDPSRLKARIRVPEAQTTGLQLGQTASIDTHNGIVPGRVSRIAPSAQNGTVTVDITLGEALPKGARVDMTIDGTIHLDRLANIRHVGRPASGSAEGDVSLFKVSADGARAERIVVRLAPASANRVQILDGPLRAGDRVVLSDTSAWPDDAVVRLR
jgi:multidrug efflux pump subunit AcrA (membrane-fusion protein)